MTPAAPAERMAVAFARVLRGAGVQVPIGSVLAFVEAVGALDLAERDHVYWAGRTLGEKLAAVYNEELARMHEHSPQRLFGLAALPMHEPDLAVKEVDREIGRAHV